MINFLTIVLLVFGVLQIILFFKLWGMTNDVAELKRLAKKYLDSQKVKSINTKEDDIKVGDLVVELKTSKQMRVTGITKENKFECKIAGGIQSAGVFDKEEIELFETYRSHIINE